ncbi:MAG: TIGR01212 family radical SAM protein, partial [Cellulosilyticaceae bacterium]
NLVVDLLEIIPPNITIHRLTADAPRKILISPEWSYKKRTILNSINAELVRRNSYQGCKL